MDQRVHRQLDRLYLAAARQTQYFFKQSAIISFISKLSVYMAVDLTFPNQSFGSIGVERPVAETENALPLPAVGNHGDFVRINTKL